MPINIIGTGEESSPVNFIPTQALNESQLGSFTIKNPTPINLSAKALRISNEHFDKSPIKTEATMQNSFSRTNLHIKEATPEQIERLKNELNFELLCIVIRDGKKTVAPISEQEARSLGTDSTIETVATFEGKIVGDDEFFSRHPDLMVQKEDGEWVPLEGLIVSKELYDQVKLRAYNSLMRHFDLLQETEEENGTGKSQEEIDNEKSLRLLASSHIRTPDREDASVLIDRQQFPFYPFNFPLKRLIAQLLISEFLYQNLQEKRAKEKEKAKRDIEVKEIDRQILKDEIKKEEIKHINIKRNP